ncbi:MAG: hypothetical protein ACHBN1_20420 [Heteroscytonema crispum UTEX LB 1556]
MGVGRRPAAQLGVSWKLEVGSWKLNFLLTNSAEPLRGDARSSLPRSAPPVVNGPPVRW